MPNIALLAGIFLAFSAVAQPAGLYGISYSTHRWVMGLPYISGGYLDVQWAALQTGPDTYDWTALDSAMAANIGQVFTPAVLAYSKPGFLFNVVPYTANWGDGQVYDQKGVLMYWHPTFVRAYTGFLAALAAHLNASPYRSFVLGFRTDFNGVGNEHLDIPVANRKASTWTVPPGVTNGPDWTLQVKENYEVAVLDAFNAGFATGPGSIRLLMRSSIEPGVLSRQATGQPAGFTYADYFRTGKWSVYQTGSEMEPRGGDTPSWYDMFLKYALSGLTTGYTIQWANAYGWAGDNLSARWCSPPQWNYWRLLSDLNMGVSEIAVYGSDLTVAQSGMYKGTAAGADYQSEFDQAFRFAERYAGRHLDAAGAPGAWIAFRQSTADFSPSDYGRRVTDYRRFITLLNPQDTTGLDARRDGAPVPVVTNRTSEGLRSIGPYSSRFGAWARALPTGNTALLQLEDAFAAGVNSATGAELRITYLDDAPGATFATAFGTQSVTTAIGNSGAWKTATMPVSSTLVRDAKGAHVAIRAAGRPVAFHMVEIVKPSIVVLNAASWQPAIAPGALVSICGNNLARETALAGGAPWPGLLGGVSVRIGGYAAPVHYVSPSQINVQVPWEVPPGPATVAITVNGVGIPPVAVTVGSAAPGVFMGADGQAIAQNQDYTLNTQQNAAARGSYVTVYLTGLGAVSDPPATGTPASGTTLSRATLPVSAWLNGVPATVVFAGLTPGFAGLAQVNLQVPNVRGTYPLAIRVGSAFSHVTMLSTK